MADGRRPAAYRNSVCRFIGGILRQPPSPTDRQTPAQTGKNYRRGASAIPMATPRWPRTTAELVVLPAKRAASAASSQPMEPPKTATKLEMQVAKDAMPQARSPEIDAQESRASERQWVGIANASFDGDRMQCGQHRHGNLDDRAQPGIGHDETEHGEDDLPSAVAQRSAGDNQDKYGVGGAGADQSSAYV